MARSIRETFRQYLPGAGKDTLGNPKQGKTRVVGEISVTSYTSGGEALSPRDFGLTRIDWMNLRVRNAVAGPASRRIAEYSQSDDVFYLYEVSNTGGADQYTAAATETVEYSAEGDSAYDVELS